MDQPRRVVGRIRPEETVFLLCDIQERFRPLIQHFPSVIHVGRQMVKAASLLSIPVVATEQNPRALGSTVAEIPPEGLSVFPKTKFSMWIPEVEAKVRERKARSAVLFGIEAHVCVLQTALDLLEQGLDVHILADGTSSMRVHDRILGLDRAKQAGAWLTTSQSMMFQLMGDAKHDKFKDLSALAKDGGPETGISHL